MSQPLVGGSVAERPLNTAVPVQAAAPTKISVQGLSKRFRSGSQSVAALDRCDFDVREGEFICIVGPSGCGKTTLLRILA
ncbi:MAG: nitrate/sulfonate/bicarbonate transporter ATP-binding protein, partial [Rhizobacter sp.]|nr:nitrate/sulfonate/bicarbonate transporter ATP-binding protein [Rhizobacter sp.]